MYMRLLGYPASSITMLTTYNGQKHLLRDVVEQRCATNPFIGRPAKITTVDKFQGQQNDYILLSLVRTKTVGHLRDVRRLTVALSRARLGLYIFGRANVFSSCFELKRSFEMLTKTPQVLKLVPEETFTGDKVLDRSKKKNIHSIGGMQDMVSFVFEFYQKTVERLQEEQPEVFNSIVNGGQQKGDDEEEEEDARPEADKEDEEELPFEKLTENDTGMDDDVIDEQMDAEAEPAKTNEQGDTVVAPGTSSASEEIDLVAKAREQQLPDDLEI